MNKTLKYSSLPGASRQDKSGGAQLNHAEIVVLGDSHAMYFLPKLMGYGRMGVDPKKLSFSGEAITAASLAGFRPGRSTLDTKDIVARSVQSADFLVLGFGQVDLELGFYYRQLVKGEDLTPESYVKWLAGIYSEFLHSLPLGHARVALKGVNLTVLTDQGFFAKYVSRIIDREHGNEQAKVAELRELVMTEEDQNHMHLAFNGALRKLARELGMAYFDVNQQLSRRHAITGLAEPRRGLAPEYLPGHFDHHLADTMAVRAVHTEAAARVFGLERLLPANWRL